MRAPRDDAPCGDAAGRPGTRAASMRAASAAQTCAGGSPLPACGRAASPSAGQVSIGDAPAGHAPAGHPSTGNSPAGRSSKGKSPSSPPPAGHFPPSSSPKGRPSTDPLPGGHSSPGDLLLQAHQRRPPLLRLLHGLALCLGLALAAGARADPLLEAALALEAEGQSEAAIRALDRLVSAAPNDLTYRLALARSLLRHKEPARARFHLLQARAAPDLTPEDRAALTRVLARLEGGKPREGWLRFALVPESNPGSRTSALSIDLGGQSWQLDPTARAKAATGLSLGFGGALTPQIREGLRLRLGASLEAKLFEDESLTDIFLRGEAGLQGLTPRGLNWRGGLTATWRHAGGESYGRAFGLQGELSQSLGRASHLRLRAEIDRWRHPRHSAQDGTRATVSAMLIHAWRPDLLLRAGVFLHRNEARADWETVSAAGLTLGAQRAFESGLVLGAEISQSRMRRAAPAPLFAETRRETRSSLALRVLHRHVSVKGFAPALELGFDRQRSTVSLYDYRNLRLSLGFTREF